MDDIVRATPIEELSMLCNIYLSILERKVSPTAIVSDFLKQQAIYPGVLACATCHLPHCTRKIVRVFYYFAMISTLEIG